jgi:intracellular septation protein A
VWIGATIGMVAADGVAIAVGTLLHRRLPERFLHSAAAVLFALFGLWILFDNALHLPWVAVVVTSTLAVAAIGTAVFRYRRGKARSGAAGTPQALDSSPEFR